MNIYDDPSSPRIVAVIEMPGVAYDDIQVSLHHDRVSIEGERRSKFPITPKSFPRNPVQAADEISSGEADMTPQIKYPICELAFGKLARWFPVSPGTQVRHSDPCYTNYT